MPLSGVRLHVLTQRPGVTIVEFLPQALLGRADVSKEIEKQFKLGV